MAIDKIGLENIKDEILDFVSKKPVNSKDGLVSGVIDTKLDIAQLSDLGKWGIDPDVAIKRAIYNTANDNLECDILLALKSYVEKQNHVKLVKHKELQEYLKKLGKAKIIVNSSLLSNMMDWEGFVFIPNLKEGIYTFYKAGAIGDIDIYADMRMKWSDTTIYVFPKSSKVFDLEYNKDEFISIIEPSGISSVKGLYFYKLKEKEFSEQENKQFIKVSVYEVSSME